MRRREFLGGTVAAATLAAAGVGGATASAKSRPYRRIATEEGWISEAVLAANARFAEKNRSPMVIVRGRAPMAEACADIGAGRIAAMDRDGIDMQVLLLASPGVQHFDAAEGAALARESNDQLADALRAHPTRFAGLAAIAPQDPVEASRELERGISRLKLNGVVINSHTNNEYLSDQKYWPILEAAESLDAAIYLHPRDPAASLAAANVPHVTAAGWAYGVEVGTHAMHMIAAGVFDRFPKLRVVIGHMGEAIPFWLPRIDNRYNTGARPLKRLPSEYVRTNFWVTTSGMNYEPQLQMTLQVIGAERLLFAVDYPFENQGEAVQLLEAMRLDDRQKKVLCEDNARRVFKISSA